MNIIRLYIKNFLCHENSFIDFTLFNSALIVGKAENSDLRSNGVGKTTIFKAIEYVLFGQADVNLEKIIRDDTDFCNITCDFEVNNQVYRLTRTRTRKGVSDLTLYEKLSLNTEEELFHNNLFEPINDKKYWKDISGRRASDTEKDLSKLLKINFKSFRVFVHFIQNDFTGLTTATPEKRKGILRDALNLVIYSKLEKIAKDKYNSLSKELEKINTLIEVIGSPDQEFDKLSNQLIYLDQEINKLLEDLLINQNNLKYKNDNIQKLINEKNELINSYSSLIVKEENLLADKSKLEISIKEYNTKKSNIVKLATDLLGEIKLLEETQAKLVKLDFNQINILSEKIISNKEKVAQLNLTIQNDNLRCDKLKIPLPKKGECEHCRQYLTEDHRIYCQSKIDNELQEKQINIKNCKKEVIELNNQNSIYQQDINNLLSSKQYLENVNTKISFKKKEITDKREIHDEYQNLLKKYAQNLNDKNKDIDQIIDEISKSSIIEANKISDKIVSEKKEIELITSQMEVYNKTLLLHNNSKAIVQHTLKQKNEDKNKKINYLKLVQEINNKLFIYPSVLQAFSSSGIPNLIIQNILNDLQIEANNLLIQLRPDLQLSFSIEKTNGEGIETDTLDINYCVNGKDRYYEQLSGAMKLAATFSLKLGLSFLLQKELGVNIKFLLLDELDQSLDKASVDAFADIVKFFQKEFKIMVITHNDRLKDKFQNAILVKQNINMVSTAQVVSSW